MSTFESMPSSMKKLYPFTPGRFKTRDGHMLSYLDEGPRDGKVLICLHGNPTWSFYYREVVKKLSPNYRVIVPDHIGCGFSDKPQDWEYRLENHIRNVKDLVRELEVEKFSLLVHDWGGAIGMGVATRLKENVDKIILLNTAAFRDIHIPKRIEICRKPIVGPLLVRTFNAFAWPATFMAVTKKLDSDVKSGFLYPYNNYQNRIATALFVRDIPMKSSHPSYQTLKNIEDELPKLKGPKLILWGGKDFCFNDHFYERWQRIYPEASTHYYEKAGHYVLEDEREDVLSRIEAFLE